MPSMTVQQAPSYEPNLMLLAEFLQKFAYLNKLRKKIAVCDFLVSLLHVKYLWQYLAKLISIAHRMLKVRESRIWLHALFRFFGQKSVSSLLIESVPPPPPSGLPLIQKWVTVSGQTTSIGGVVAFQCRVGEL